MDASLQEIIENMYKRLEDVPYMKAEDLPGIDLYMDQVTTLMEENLSPVCRSESEKILTKTMINNYAKNHLLPPPIKKKYSREHMYLLVIVYFLKGFLSLQDIRKIVQPLTDDISKGEGRFDMDALYKKICSLQQEQIPRTKEDLQSLLENESGSIPGLQDLLRTSPDSQSTKDDPDGTAYLQVLSVICSLATDVFVKKRIIEELIDSCL